MIRKNKVVEYQGPTNPQIGNIRYWDGSNWIPLANGNDGDKLITHDVGLSPTWESQNSIYFSSEATIAADPTGTGAGTDSGSVYNAAAMGDVHLLLGGNSTEGVTYDRNGNKYIVGFPQNASWNCDDNIGTEEIDFLIIEDPTINKLVRIRYSQKENSPALPGLTIEKIKVISEELTSSSSSATSVTGACSFTSASLNGNGPCNITFDSSDDVNLTITGTYWDGTQNQNVNTTLDQSFSVSVGGIRFTIHPDSRDLGGASPYVFFSFSPYIPKGLVWHNIAFSGGRFGGLFWEIIDSARLYRDGLEDTNGHPDLLALGYTAEESTIGVWGIYTSEISSSSSSSSQIASSSSSSSFTEPVEELGETVFFFNPEGDPILESSSSSSSFISSSSSSSASQIISSSSSSSFVEPVEELGEMVFFFNPEGDPILESSSSSSLDGTVLLMHMDGSDGGTTFADSSPNNLTITANGGSETDTAIKKFGSASALFDGVNGYLSVPIVNEWDMAANWCFDFWCYIATADLSRGDRLFGRGAEAAEFQIFNHFSGTQNIRCNSECGANDIALDSGDNAYTGDTWFHVAVVKSGTNAYLFVDGVLEDSDTCTDDTGVTYNELFVAARKVIGPTDYFKGQIDEVRIVNHDAINTSGDPLYISSGNPADGFSPPTSPYV
jgi:hypothetical protein